MAHPDTIKLLQECDAGTKMGVSSIDEVLEKVKDEKLKKLLSESKAHHEKLEEDIEHLLEQMDAEEKDPNPMAKGMSWIKTNMKWVGTKVMPLWQICLPTAVIWASNPFTVI